MTTTTTSMGATSHHTTPHHTTPHHTTHTHTHTRARAECVCVWLSKSPSTHTIAIHTIDAYHCITHHQHDTHTRTTSQQNKKIRKNVKTDHPTDIQTDRNNKNFCCAHTINTLYHQHTNKVQYTIQFTAVACVLL